MLLNRFEKALMNNPVRAAVQRRVEARVLLTMGGPVRGKALEVGCGRGVGTRIILDAFGATSVDAFDLDPHMVELARTRLRDEASRVRLWTGDVSRIEADDESYDAVFDFGIIHHVPDWRAALAEVFRVLKPGGRFYVEEVLRDFILHPVAGSLFDHPLQDRFDHRSFCAALSEAGFQLVDSHSVLSEFGWFIADKPEAAQ